MGKTIMVLLDGCSYESAIRHMGYLEHLCESGLGSKYKVIGELPAMSRPMYETLMTGLKVRSHGVYSNMICRKSSCKNIFKLCEDKGLTTAASAYFWMSELYNNAPFNYINDRISLDRLEGINHGVYYYEDNYPDSHVFGDGEWLRKTYCPDFLLIHSMNIDDIGHKQGGSSKEYYTKVMQADTILANIINEWITDGYNVVVTSDHGMNEWGFHCGNGQADRTVPLYIFSSIVKKGDFTNREIPQLAIAPLICKLLGIEKEEGMISDEAMGVEWI